MKGVKDGGKGTNRRPEVTKGSFSAGYDRIFKQETTVRDPDDDDTIDWVDMAGELGIPPELDFNDDNTNTSEDEIVVCPSCHENEVSTEQVQCQVEGEQCSICNFHTWEEL